MRDVTAPSEKVMGLIQRGVSIPNPCSVDVGDDVDVTRIAHEDVIFYSGTKIYGKETLIGPGARLGYEAPVTLVDCQLGSQVELKGGFFTRAVFLDRSTMASGAHVREGSILEEEASCSHTVGLKQTILFPFVTIGSLVNFCDCLMAGGTSRQDHSEVGSSYIHFNYTPNQDKATASLIGDVPRGVMLNQPPVFLGGQGGLVGPARIGYGTVIEAGTVYRGDSPDGGKLIHGKMESAYTEREFLSGYYGEVGRKIENNILYIANLLALKEWYRHVRRPFFDLREQGPALYEGAVEKIKMALSERLSRFAALAEKMERSIAAAERLVQSDKRRKLISHKKRFMENWDNIEGLLTGKGERDIACDTRDAFCRIIEERISGGDRDYIETIQSLDGEAASMGTAWLQAVVDTMHTDGTHFWS